MTPDKKVQYPAAQTHGSHRDDDEMATGRGQTGVCERAWYESKRAPEFVQGVIAQLRGSLPTVKEIEKELEHGG